MTQKVYTRPADLEDPRRTHGCACECVVQCSAVQWSGVQTHALLRAPFLLPLLLPLSLGAAVSRGYWLATTVMRRVQ